MDAAELAAWVEETTGGHTTAAQMLDLVLHLVAGPHCVRSIESAGRRTGVGVLIDTCETAGNVAELNAFLDADAPPDTLPALLAWGESLALAGPRSGLDVPLEPGRSLSAAPLEAAGYTLAYALWSMRADPLPTPPTAPSPPPGFAWRPVTEVLVPAFHRTTARAFADVPGSFVPDLAMFTDRCLRDTTADRRVLTDGERVAAFVRVQVRGEVGYVASLGRDPEFRGVGLGSSALAEGLRRLGEARVRRAELDVAARNRDALALYERAGFRTTEEMRVFRKPLRRPPCV